LQKKKEKTCVLKGEGLLSKKTCGKVLLGFMGKRFKPKNKKVKGFNQKKRQTWHMGRGEIVHAVGKKKRGCEILWADHTQTPTGKKVAVLKRKKAARGKGKSREPSCRNLKRTKKRNQSGGKKMT